MTPCKCRIDWRAPLIPIFLRGHPSGGFCRYPTGADAEGQVHRPWGQPGRRGRGRGRRRAGRPSAHHCSCERRRAGWCVKVRVRPRPRPRPDPAARRRDVRAAAAELSGRAAAVLTQLSRSVSPLPPPPAWLQIHSGSPPADWHTYVVMYVLLIRVFGAGWPEFRSRNLNVVLERFDNLTSGQG